MDWENVSPKFSASPPPEIARRNGSATDGSLRRGPVHFFIARLQSLNQAWGRRAIGLPKWQIARFVGGYMSFWLVIVVYRQHGVLRWQAYCGNRRRLPRSDPQMMPRTETPKVDCRPFYSIHPSRVYLAKHGLGDCNIMPHAVGGIEMRRFDAARRQGSSHHPHGSRDKVAALSWHRLFPSGRYRLQIGEARRGEARCQRYAHVCPANPFAAPTADDDYDISHTSLTKRLLRRIGWH